MLMYLASHVKSFYNNSNCQDLCSTPLVNDFLIYLSALPLIINGLSYLLVFVTTIEFICVQSPNAMKGLLKPPSFVSFFFNDNV